MHIEFGESQDIYLAEIGLPGDSGETVLIRLIDEYPSWRVAIPPGILTAAGGGAFRLRREHACDVSFVEMPLRTAPGDPMAILPERLGFQPALPRDVRSNEILPCYRTVRK